MFIRQIASRFGNTDKVIAKIPSSGKLEFLQTQSSRNGPEVTIGL
jgi:hypothetical protein